MPTSAMSGDGGGKQSGLSQRSSGGYLVKSVAPTVDAPLRAVSPKLAPVKNQRVSSDQFMVNSLPLNQGPK